jgi:hypothetical protein
VIYTLKKTASRKSSIRAGRLQKTTNFRSFWGWLTLLTALQGAEQRQRRASASRHRSAPVTAAAARRALKDVARRRRCRPLPLCIESCPRQDRADSHSTARNPP